MASSKLARRRQGSVPKEGPAGFDSNNGSGFDPTLSLIPHGATRHNMNGHSNGTSGSGSKFMKDLKLDDLDMIKTIGTGTFARVYLCRPKANKNRSVADYFALKILAMHDVIRLKQVDHVKNEKSILAEIRHPFIVDLLW